MKIFVREKFIPEDFKDYTLVTPRDVEFNDTEGWLKLMHDNFNNANVLIVFPEAYLNIIQQEELLSNTIPKCSFFTSSPYITNNDELMDYISWELE